MVIEGIVAESRKELTRRSYDIEQFFNGERSLIKAFSWSFTPQGFGFWNQLHNLQEDEKARLELARTLVELGLGHMVPPKYEVVTIPEELLWE